MNLCITGATTQARSSAGVKFAHIESGTNGRRGRRTAVHSLVWRGPRASMGQMRLPIGGPRRNWPIDDPMLIMNTYRTDRYNPAYQYDDYSCTIIVGTY